MGRNITVWEDGYDFTVDGEKLEQADGWCHIFHPDTGWRKLRFVRNRNRDWYCQRSVYAEMRPEDALIARLVINASEPYSSTCLVRTREATLTTEQGLAIAQA